jgi:methionine synthase II (cobalamin-independent)
MNMKDKDLLMELLGEIKYWNNTDIECFDDTTPNMEMLEARRDVIEKVLKLVKKIK